MKIFDQNLDLLKQLFSEKEISAKIDRLKYIFENTETSWLKNLELFRNQEIKYILICEAPPYSEDEIPKYFYNQTDRKFNITIWRIFFEHDQKPNSEREYYKKLAEKGFLLIDNLPFSMKYTPKLRRKSAYKKLIENSLDWFLENLRSNKLRISNDVKIAFGFKLNALKFLEVTNGTIKIQNSIIKFDENNIGADGSGFPNSEKISKIFFPNQYKEFSEYQYFNGEIENPYLKKGDSELDFKNPKSLFWYYEKFHFKNNKKEDFKIFMENLIHNKLSEYVRSDFDLWKLYFKNSTK